MMDAERFDRLVKTLSTVDTRRGLLRLSAALPLAGLSSLLTEAGVQGSGSGAIVGGGGGRRRRRKARQRRRKARRHHDPGNDKENRKGRRKQCKPNPAAKTCAGRCGTVKNNCGKRVDCGAGLLERCDSADQCCAADQTRCGFNSVAFPLVCCRPLGGACTSGGVNGDCCFVAVDQGEDAPGCPPGGGACGGSGAGCRFNGQCVSGQCTANTCA